MSAQLSSSTNTLLTISSESYVGTSKILASDFTAPSNTNTATVPNRNASTTWFSNSVPPSRSLYSLTILSTHEETPLPYSQQSWESSHFSGSQKSSTESQTSLSPKSSSQSSIMYVSFSQALQSSSISMIAIPSSSNKVTTTTTETSVLSVFVTVAPSSSGLGSKGFTFSERSQASEDILGSSSYSFQQIHSKSTALQFQPSSAYSSSLFSSRSSYPGLSSKSTTKSSFPTPFTTTQIASSSTTSKATGPTGIVPYVGEFSFIGCYNETKEIGQPFTFDGARFSDSITMTGMTVPVCASLCESYIYFGIEYGYECYCANHITPGAAPNSVEGCNMPCPGDHATLCGGSWRLVAYQKIQHSGSSSSNSIPGLEPSSTSIVSQTTITSLSTASTMSSSSDELSPSSESASFSSVVIPPLSSSLLPSSVCNSKLIGHSIH